MVKGDAIFIFSTLQKKQRNPKARFFLSNCLEMENYRTDLVFNTHKYDMLFVWNSKSQWTIRMIWKDAAFKILNKNARYEGSKPRFIFLPFLKVETFRSPQLKVFMKNLVWVYIYRHVFHRLCRNKTHVKKSDRVVRMRL